MATFSKVPVINVHKDNIKDMYNPLLNAVRSASYIAIDLELTGIGSGANKKDMQERYNLASNAAKSRSIVSLGLSCFSLVSTESESNKLQFAVQAFNLFFLCGKEHVIQPESIKFLVDHDFDFNFQYKYGLKYIPGNLDLETEFGNILMNIFRCEVPIVLHNAFIDLLFLYQSFIAELPSTLTVFIANLSSIFKGGVYDTKYIAEYTDRTGPSYLQYVFRKCQYDNLSRSENNNSHIVPVFPIYPKNIVINLDCQLPGPNFIPDNNICEKYANYGWCLKGNECKSSHHIDSILKQKSCRKRKWEERNENVDNKTITKSKNGHRAGYDSFMTGFVFGYFLCKHCNVNSQFKKIKDFQFEKQLNMIYLVGKDFGLEIKKSEFTNISATCNNLVTKIFGTC